MHACIARGCTPGSEARPSMVSLLCLALLAVAAAGHSLTCPLRAPLPVMARRRFIAATMQSKSSGRGSPGRRRWQLYKHVLPKARGSNEVERLLAEHPPRGVREFSIGISAFGRSKDWRRALSLLD